MLANILQGSSVKLVSTGNWTILIRQAAYPLGSVQRPIQALGLTSNPMRGANG
jgi:hypothetical protein